MITALSIVAIIGIACFVCWLRRDIELSVYDPDEQVLDIKKLDELSEGEVIFVLGHIKERYPVIQLLSTFDIVKGENTKQYILLDADRFTLQQDEVYALEGIGTKKNFKKVTK